MELQAVQNRRIDIEAQTEAKRIIVANLKQSIHDIRTTINEANEGISEEKEQNLLPSDICSDVMGVFDSERGSASKECDNGGIGIKSSAKLIELHNKIENARVYALKNRIRELESVLRRSNDVAQESNSISWTETMPPVSDIQGSDESHPSARFLSSKAFGPKVASTCRASLEALASLQFLSEEEVQVIQQALDRLNEIGIANEDDDMSYDLQELDRLGKSLQDKFELVYNAGNLNATMSSENTVESQRKVELVDSMVKRFSALGGEVKVDKMKSPDSSLNYTHKFIQHVAADFSKKNSELNQSNYEKRKLSLHVMKLVCTLLLSSGQVQAMVKEESQKACEDYKMEVSSTQVKPKETDENNNIENNAVAENSNASASVNQSKDTSETKEQSGAEESVPSVSRSKIENASPGKESMSLYDRSIAADVVATCIERNCRRDCVEVVSRVLEFTPDQRRRVGLDQSSGFWTTLVPGWSRGQARAQHATSMDQSFTSAFEDLIRDETS